MSAIVPFPKRGPLQTIRDRRDGMVQATEIMKALAWDREGYGNAVGLHDLFRDQLVLAMADHLLRQADG